MQTGKYKPYSKPNNVLSYVNSKSNHPPLVTKNIPKGIATRLTTISSDEKIFKDSIKPYVDALNKAGHKEELKFRDDIAKNIKAEAENIKIGGPKNNDIYHKKKKKKEHHLLQPTLLNSPENQYNKRN